MGRSWGFLGKLVSPKEWKELLNGKKVGFLRKVGFPQGAEASWWGEGWFLGKGVSFGELIESPSREKVVSPGKGISLEETLQRGTMISLGIGWNLVGRGEWGFPKQYKGYFSYEGRGDEAKEQLVYVGYM